MSTPLFVRTPTNGSGTTSILGASLAAYSGATAMVDLTAANDEPILVEEIAWCAEVFSTQAGMLVLALVDGSGNRRLIGSYTLAAGTGTLFASDRIEVDITIAPGSKLVAAHNVQNSAGSAYVRVDVVPLGGVVR